jgi:hypothetical protein
MNYLASFVLHGAFQIASASFMAIEFAGDLAVRRL